MSLKKIFSALGGVAIAGTISGCASTGVYDYTGASTVIGAATGGLIAREVSNGDYFATGVGVAVGGAVGNMIGGATRNPCVTRTDGVVTERIYNGTPSRHQTTQTRVSCQYQGRPADFRRPTFQ